MRVKRPLHRESLAEIQQVEEGLVEGTDVFRHLRMLRRHASGCPCHDCIGALNAWVAETSRENRLALEAELKRRTEMAVFTLVQQIAAVEHEISMRENLYPRYVATGKMKQAEAEQRIAEMQSVRKTLLWVMNNQKVIREAVNITPEVAAVK